MPEHIVHYLQYGMTPHPMPMPPRVWPDGHLWDSDPGNVNCDDCKQALVFEGAVYTIELDARGQEKSITCRRCKRTSHNPNDIRERYCGCCHVFLDDIWPPARKWWLEHSEESVNDWQI